MIMMDNNGTTGTEGKDEGGIKHRDESKRHKKKNVWTLFYANVQGIRSKRDSLINIFDEINPKIAFITETQLTSNSAIKIEGYTFFGKSREKKSGGGVGILVENEIKGSVAPHVSSRDIEIIWVSIKRRNQSPIFMGVYYGKQEGEGKKEDIESEMSELTEEILELEREGEIILFMDANAKIGLMGEGVSRNGKLLKEVMEETTTYVINGTEKCKGTITRQNRRKQEEKSAIDLVLATHRAEGWIRTMNIDEDGQYRARGKNESDHNSIIVEIVMEEVEYTGKRRTVVWNLKAPKEKWEQYRRLLAEELHNLRRIMSMNEDMDTRYEQWNRRINQCGMESIGKTTIKDGEREKFSKAIQELRKKKKNIKRESMNEMDPCKKDQLWKKYMQMQVEVRDEISKEKKQKLEKRLEEVKDKNTFWKERKRMKRDETTEWTITKDENGKRLYGAVANKENAATYYEALFKKPMVQEHEYHKEVERNVAEHENDRDYEEELYNKIPTRTEVEAAINQKKNGKATTDFKNEMIKNGGEPMVDAVMVTLEAFWMEETAPKHWNKGIITSLWKGKGDREMLKNHRGITVSSSIGTIPEVILNERFMKHMTFTQAQAGGRKKCSPYDHVFIIRAIIQYALKTKKRIILTFYDVAKAFDHAEVDDMFETVWNSGVKGKIWRLGKRLQEQLTATVKTRYGETRTIERENGGRQGGHLMPTIFGKIMDTLPETLLQEKTTGAAIKGELIPALLFVDDVASITEGYEDQEKMLQQVNEFAIKHKMEWGADKCKVLEIGRHKNPKKQWSLGEKTIDGAKEYKYLGDVITRNGTNTRNLDERRQKVLKTMRAVKSCSNDEVMKEIQNEAILRLHEMVVIPTLLNNAESWTLTKTEELICNRIEAFALKKTLGLPLTFPTVALVYVTGTLFTSIRIEKKKLIFLHKILTRGRGHWTTHMLYVLDELETGWALDIREKLKLYGLEEDWEIIKGKTTSQWKSEVIKATEKKNKEQLLEGCYEENGNEKQKTKHMIKEISRDGYVRAPCQAIKKMNRNQARIILIARFRMLDCASNYGQRYKSKNCGECGEIDDENHRINGCGRSRTDGKNWMEFDDIYQDNKDTIKQMIDKIKEKWNVRAM